MVVNKYLLADLVGMAGKMRGPYAKYFPAGPPTQSMGSYRFLAETRKKLFSWLDLTFNDHLFSIANVSKNS